MEMSETYSNEQEILNHLKSGVLYEPDISSLFLNVIRKGDTVVDVGANVGFFTLLSAVLVGSTGKIIAFEPDENNYNRLNTSIMLNSFSHITVVRKPVSNKIGPVDFHINSNAVVAMHYGIRDYSLEM